MTFFLLLLHKRRNIEYIPRFDGQTPNRQAPELTRKAHRDSRSAEDRRSLVRTASTKIAVLLKPRIEFLRLVDRFAVDFNGVVAVNRQMPAFIEDCKPRLRPKTGSR